MKLSGKTNAYVVIRIVRVPVVHVRTVSIEVTNVDEVAIRRLLFVAFFPLLQQVFTSVNALYLFGSSLERHLR